MLSHYYDIMFVHLCSSLREHSSEFDLSNQLNTSVTYQPIGIGMGHLKLGGKRRNIRPDIEMLPLKITLCIVISFLFYFNLHASE